MTANEIGTILFFTFSPPFKPAGWVIRQPQQHFFALLKFALP
jgi:hypothetical protein